MNRNLLRLSVVIVWFIFYKTIVYGQGGNGSPCDLQAARPGYFATDANNIEVELDRLSGIPKGEVPFDRWFYFKKVVKSSNKLFSVALADPDTPTKPTVNLCFEQNNAKDNDGYDEIHILIPPLRPNKNFRIVFSYFLNEEELETYFQLFQAIHEVKDPVYLELIGKIKNVNSYTPTYGEFKIYYEDNLKAFYTNYNAEPSPDEKQKIKRQIFDRIQAYAMNTSKGLILLREIELSNFAQQNFNFETRAKNILLPTIGYIYYRKNLEFNGYIPFVGVTINFRSYDTNIPLKYIKNNFVNRLSGQIGVTFGSVAKTNQRSDLLGSRNLLLGLGYSFSHAFKANVGFLMYNKLDNNPLINSPKIGGVPYGGFSLDIRIKQIIADLGSIFSGDLLPAAR